MKTPVGEEQTPQRSILRGINSVSKKRRVAFIPDNEKHNDSDSSSSELMEIEPMDIDQFARGKSTPIHIRPSPRVKVSEPTRQPLKTPQLNRVPRGPPIKLNPKQQQIKGYMGKENDQYNALFPNETRENKIVKKKEIMAGSNMRKTPSKQTKAKFFSVSPKQRKEAASKARKSDKVEDMAWFDLDSVFGFGPED
ncbi:hypothetical protein LOTGIDRAFT_235081 [Lottia gigantea]|uniref:Uncharacterized protein n=1 Tax=Lottia gigantea TaxID=225164 RepID=V3ZXS5_LOTGI|nr:hypothetical protein LOTGIDRAFT_235081 [Lottia gigantea]ESO87405.1 hypothetical protein LOTGIDRAFT_235081 [Lottia gigantea]